MMTQHVLRAGCALVLAAGLAACAPGGAPGDEPQPPEMPVLLHQAWERTVQEHGAGAAESRFAAMQERNAELRSALRTRELARVRAAQEALRAEQVRLVAGALGADAPRQVLDAVAALLEELDARIATAADEGHETERARAALHDASTMHAEATAAMERGEHELALEVALRAVDAVTTARVAARSF